MSDLVIIGNGFDLAHDLPTKYSDFLEFLRKMDITNYQISRIEEFEYYIP